MRGSKRALRALMAGALVATGLAVTVNPAAADDVACGAIITEDTTLHEDVGPCTGDGLIVTASGVHLDLGGYRVFMEENGDGDNAGIRLAMVTGAHVLNGTVEGFDAGIVVGGGGGNILHELTVQDNVNDFSDELLLEETCELGDGIALLNSDGNTIENNNVDRNGPYGGISTIGDADSNIIRNNKVRDQNIESPSGSGCGNTFQDEGVRIEGPGSSQNVVDRNVVVGSLLGGISMHGHVCSTAGGDPEVEPANRGNIVTNNTVRGTAEAGIIMLQQGPRGVVCPSFQNTIRRNISVQNGTEGIFVSTGSNLNIFDRNAVNQNGTDGIVLNGPSFGTEFTNVGPTVFDVTDPDQPPYVEETDFAVMFGSGSGDVTAEIVAIDLAIGADDPATPELDNLNPVDTSTSGCEADDFTDAGFEAGDVALIQRGTCTFVAKVDNAIAAGASAVVMFNEGQAGRTTFDFGSVGAVAIPVLSAEYAVGVELADLIEAEVDPVIVNIVTNTTTETVLTSPGAHDNTLTKNVGRNNLGLDAFDGTLDPPCDNNDWINNFFKTVNQPCVDGDAVVIEALLAPQSGAAGNADADLLGVGRGGTSTAPAASSAG